MKPSSNLLILLLLVQTGCSEKPVMKLPHQPDAKSCYEDIRKVPVLGQAIDKMIAESEKEAPFQARLKAILDLRMKSIEVYRERPLHDAALKEEADYVCAGNDLLAGAFMQEIERVGTLPEPERKAHLTQLADSLEKIELNPQWNTYTRPRIAGRIAQVREGR